MIALADRFWPTEETKAISRTPLLQYWQDYFKQYSDKLLQYSIYETVEETLANYKCEDYYNMKKRALNDKVKFEQRIEKPDLTNYEATVFDIYTIEQLKYLYKSYTLYLTTDFFKKLKKKIGYIPYITYANWADTYEKLSSANAANELSIETQLNNHQYKSENEKRNLIQMKTAIKACNETLLYFGGGIEWLREKYETKWKGNIRHPDLIVEDLHINDDIYMKSGHPTDEEVYRFIWEELRTCTIKDLEKLLKCADKKFATVNPGRPISKWKILQYDMKGNLVETYDSRAECMEKNNIKKSMMSQLISGKKQTHKGFRYVEQRMNNL